MEKMYNDLETLIELCAETNDTELEQELLVEMKNFKRLETTKLETLLSGKHDEKTPSFPFMREQEAQRLKIGLGCCCACIPGGLKIKHIM